MSNPITNRYDFALMFDVKDGNPNGDPDAGNLPRVDPETGQGLVTDVCLKRKIRNFVHMTKELNSSYDIFVKEKAILNNLIEGAYQELGIDLKKPPVDEKDGKKRNDKNKGQGSEVESARQQMCKSYYDIRTFGAVMSTGPNAGQVRGPVQMTFARSMDAIVTLEHSITRMAVATQTEAEKQGGDNRTMGRKNTVSYGLYQGYGFISPHLAAQTGFNEDDLKLLWDALVNMFEHDHSAARGMMSTCKLVIFKHASALGNAPSKALFDCVKIERNNPDKPPRDVSDYTISIDHNNLPEGIEIIEMP
jgi:CRISPR-associated protein Cas7/Csd2, subtype I-C/DVULG